MKNKNIIYTIIGGIIKHFSNSELIEIDSPIKSELLHEKTIITLD